jgi:hypothetical protein
MFRCAEGHDDGNDELLGSDTDMKITAFWDVASCGLLGGFLHFG